MEFDAVGATKSLNIVVEAQTKAFKRSSDKTAVQISQTIKKFGDADIRRAGKFGVRWTNAFAVNPVSRKDTNTIRMGFTSAIPYALIFEYGGIVKGRPLLWIPLPWNPDQESGPREHSGELFFVARPGKNPLLLDAQSSVPLFVGVPSVTIRPRFHLRQIASNTVRRLAPELYYANLKKEEG